jgi:hypothetical protein
LETRVERSARAEIAARTAALNQPAVLQEVEATIDSACATRHAPPPPPPAKTSCDDRQRSISRPRS